MRRRLLLGPVLAGGLLFALAGPAYAAIIVNLTPGTVQETTALTTFATSGNEMVGMSVTAFFVGGATETVAWAATGTGAGAAGGTLFTLAESGDTYSSSDPWSLTVSSGTMSRLVIDAGAGDTVFDITFGGATGTPGSARGRTFKTSQTVAGNITATYRDLIALAGSAPVGDLYRFLELDFSGLQGGGLTQGLRFSADTDNLEMPGDLTRVPEPGSLALFGIGLAALGILGRRRKAAQSRT